MNESLADRNNKRNALEARILYFVRTGTVHVLHEVLYIQVLVQVYAYSTVRWYT